jgi:iron only hydrogenase large subunit-like protein
MNKYDVFGYGLILVAESARALRKEDSKKKIRKSHQNPDVLRLYKEYLGVFGGEKAHKLLHTTYTNRCVIKDCK